MQRFVIGMLATLVLAVAVPASAQAGAAWAYGTKFSGTMKEPYDVVKCKPTYTVGREASTGKIYATIKVGNTKCQFSIWMYYRVGAQWYGKTSVWMISGTIKTPVSADEAYIGASFLYQGVAGSSRII